MTGSGYVVSRGARLYWEVEGTGPPVLLVPGGASDAHASAGLVAALATDHRVVTYDRRGIARSAAAGDGSAVTLWTHADDAAAVIGAAVGDGPVGVVGASIGALLGLHVLVRHPERVARLVAHEPPMAAVVRDEEREHALDGVASLFDREGPVSAIRGMARVLGIDPATLVLEDGAVLPQPPPTVLDDLTTFFTHDFPAVRAETLDADDLRDVPAATLVLTGGELSRDGWEHRCAATLARETGRELALLPGGHHGPLTHPRAWAARLRELL